MMDPTVTNMLIYAGLAVGGYLVRLLQARNAAPAPATPVVPVPAQPDAKPGLISIGHGELLSLLIAAFQAAPPLPVMPAPAATPVIDPALLKALSQLQQQPPTK